jgi:hypothetical protein
LKNDEIQLKQRGQDHHSKYGARRLADGVTSRFQASRPKVEVSHKRLQYHQHGKLNNNIEVKLVAFNINSQDVVATPDHIETKPMIKSNGELNTVPTVCTDDNKQYPATTTKFDNNTGNQRIKYCYNYKTFIWDLVGN